MKAHSHVQATPHDDLHLLARVVGMLAIVTLALYLRALASGGFLAVTLEGPASWVGLLVVLGLGLLALVAAWRWERVGGVLAVILGLPLALYIWTAVPEHNVFNALIYASPLILAGGLYLLDAWYQKPGRDS